MKGGRDILGDYGPNHNSPQRPRSNNGGQMPVRDVMNYKPPVGPTNINDSKSPGLHGNNYGNCGTQGPRSRSPSEGGSPGLHGSNMGKSGTQK